MQVADAMGDRGDQAWVAALAALAIWSDAAAADPVHCTLLRLPDPLLHCVTSACLKHAGLADLLSTFPASLHAAATSAAVRTVDTTYRSAMPPPSRRLACRSSA